MPGYNVTVSAMFEDAPSTQAGITYTAIVQQSTGGMISVNPTAAAAGNWINVTTQPNAGKRILAGSLAYKYIASPSGAEATASIASTGFTMPGSNVTISAIFENIPVSLTAGSITIEVSPAPKSPYSVYVYNSALNLYRWKDVGGSSNGGVTIGSSIAAIIPTSVAIDNLPLDRDYQVSIYMGEEESYYTKQQTVQLNSSDVTQAFAIPVMFSISGSLTLTNGSAPAEYTYVTARDTSTGQEFYGYTNIAGEYKIRGLSAATYNVSYSNWNSKYVGTLTQSAIITNQDVTGIDLVLIKGAGLRGTVTNNNIGPFKAKISLWKKDASQSYQYATSAYSGSTGFNMEGIIKEQGDYKLQLDYIQNRDGTNPAYVSNPTEFTVTAGDIVSGIIGQNITYSDPSRPTQALSGQGNQVLTDLKTVYNGNHVNLKVSFKNNGNTTVSPIFSIVLPNGLSFSNASQATYTAINLKPGQNGQHNAVIRIDNPLHDTAKIQVKVQVGSGSAFDFGDAGLIVSRVTLNGPGAVKPDETFKVYGEATSGSTIAIKNIDSNQIYAAVTPTGRFYSAAIGPLPEGNYRFVAEATVNGVTSTSDILDVESKERQIAIKSVTINSNGMTDLPMNKIIGVRGFTAWVDSAMRGRDINLGVEFENAGDIASVRYNFADLTFGGIKGNTFYDANLTGWYGAGLKTITATVTTVDGRILNFIIAEATILIDPSGIVTDKSTGRPVSGVEMICYILNGVIWEKWDAELYGQINPQKTDNDGKYGWMVPAGIYKVTATKAGYLPYDTMNDPKFSTNGNSTIIIPPPREDVNIELIPIGDNSSTSDEEDIGPNQNTNKDAVLKPTDDRIDQIKDIRGHWGSVAISYVISNKIMSGTSSTEFSPNTNMTRAMMVAVFANLQGIPFDAQAKSGFNDVEVGSWYGSAVTWAAKNKLVSGDGKGNFAAERKITREEMAVMLYQYAKMIGKDISAKEELSKFKDGQETSDWAKEAMIWAVSNGLFQGKENNTLDPKGKATRAEIATIIYKFSVDL